MELCVDFGGTEVKAGVFASGRLVFSRSFAVPTSLAELDELIASAASSVDERIDGIGIAVPGVVQPGTGRMLAAHGKYPYLMGPELDLAVRVRDRIGADVVVENDARAALVGELADGPAAGESDAVLIVLGTGVGTAAVMGGEVVRGATGHAGILGGHVSVDLDGPVCPCGNIGCAEALASTWAIPSALRAMPGAGESPLAWRIAAGERIGIGDVVAVADEDDAAGALLERFVAVWAAAVVSMCHAYDPAVVIVSGGVMRSADRVLPRLEALVHARLWSSSVRPAFVVPDRPELSVLRGLSVLAARTATKERA